MGVVHWLLLLFWSLIVSTSALAQLTINEIMYDPGQCSDTYCEWIELYNTNESALNLTNCQLEGRNLTTSIPGNGYLIAARNINNFTTYFGAVENIIQLSFSLTNTGDTITLNGTSYCNDSVDYTPFVDLAFANDKTLEKDNEGNWRESKFVNGTPGRENSVANISSDLSFLAISEVLANPFENDDALKPEGEWIEILNYGPQEIYAGGLKITDLNDEHELFIADSSVLNEGDLFVPPGSYIVVYRDGDSDFSLNNYDYEEVRLFSPDDELIDFMSYTGTTEGMSWSGINDEWYETSPTPGEDNEYTGECIWFLYIDMNNSIFKPEDFEFSIMVSRAAGLVDNVTVRGTIEDFNGKVVSDYAPWTNEMVVSDRSKKYSPNLADGFYQTSFNFIDPPCLDVDPNDYRVTQAFAISSSYQLADSALAITKVNLGSDNKVPWGGQFTTELEVYRGNTTTKALAAWVEKDGKIVSKKTALEVERQYQFYPVTIPVQLHPNCNQEIGDGSSTLVVEGLGKRAEESINIGGLDTDVCKKYTSQIRKELKKLQQQQKKENKTTAKAQQFFLEELPAAVAPGEVLRLSAHILNDDKKKHNYQIWSYLFRGNKCYSCLSNTVAREANRQTFTLDPQEAKEVEFLLKLDDTLKEGEYKVKVKLRKDEQKTVKELTGSIYVLIEKKEEVQEEREESKEKESGLTALAKKTEQQPNLLAQKRKVADGLTGFVVYESSSERRKEVVPYVLIVALIVTFIIIVKKP